MNIFHLVKVYFHRNGPGADEAWLLERFEFFKQYTLESLRRQTFQRFMIWIHCEPGMQEVMYPLRQIIPAAVFTFGEHFPAEIIPKHCSHVCVTRIDSDDLYSPTALQCVADIKPLDAPISAALFRKGYIHDIKTGTTGVFYNPSPPFHALFFERNSFVDPVLYREKFVGDHSMIRKAYPFQDLPDWKFCVLVHGQNWTTTFDYSRLDNEHVPAGFSVNHFLSEPVVFDVDDFCDKWNCLPDLFALREVYPNFRATLFTIPGACGDKTCFGLLDQLKRINWLEYGVHGINHEPNEEMKTVSRERLSDVLGYWTRHYGYAKVFRPPGWYLNDETIAACNDAGCAVAMHVRDKERYAAKCDHGYYYCGERLPYWHGHTHDVCGNWLHGHLEELKTKWPRDQAFSFVSDAVLLPRGTP